MATRATEATALNGTLATLKTDVEAYLGAGVGDHHEARQAVWNAIVGRLNPVLGAIEHRTPTTITDSVPDQTHEDEVAG